MRGLTMRERSGLGAVAAALVVLAFGGWAYQKQGGDPSLQPLMEITPPKKVMVELKRGTAPEDMEVTENADAPVPGSPMVVYVSGAVKRPGVYTLKTGDRIYKAIQAAGGFKGNAVQGALNLADLLQDGDQINVPGRPQAAAAVPPPVRHAESPATPSRPAAPPRETASRRGRVLGKPVAPAPPPRSATPSRNAAETAAPAAGAGTEKLRSPGEGTVNINTATEGELQRLPGVGPAMAARILAYRQEVGGFKSPEQLMDVKGIGEKKFGAMQPFVRVD